MPLGIFQPRLLDRRLTLLRATAVAAAAIIALAAYSAMRSRTASAEPATSPSPAPSGSAAYGMQSVHLTDSQLGSIKVGAVSERDFPMQKEAVGGIDFNEDMDVQVFSPYQGRIIQAFANLGDEVRKGQTLFTIESHDFIAAESNLIAAAATLDQTTSALERAKKLYAVKGIDQNDHETAVANQQSAEGALRAARNAVAIFGKTEAQIDHIVASPLVENVLVVKSPITGRITSRNAAPGLLEQPGVAPARSAEIRRALHARLRVSLRSRRIFRCTFESRERPHSRAVRGGCARPLLAAVAHCVADWRGRSTARVYGVPA